MSIAKDMDMRWLVIVRENDNVQTLGSVNRHHGRKQSIWLGFSTDWPGERKDHQTEERT
jgi:hypothetical protein